MKAEIRALITNGRSRIKLPPLTPTFIAVDDLIADGGSNWQDTDDGEVPNPQWCLSPVHVSSTRHHAKLILVNLFTTEGRGFSLQTIAPTVTGSKYDFGIGPAADVMPVAARVLSDSARKILEPRRT
ncbi:hypothetical protein QN219_23500 [Sinorhizobium sp. 7-81]|uniref:hypothetical protein n=1 Tax=Sinorhizobium sp. 8-89 TaxID=3049089 RepID=UPI0024C2EB8C|nr:hypothetical protein [Sinorhizobium sp. 8-89]MDK1492982.1 hypothetical protein [Sinorhizobium sp. 8-89]